MCEIKEDFLCKNQQANSYLQLQIGAVYFSQTERNKKVTTDRFGKELNIIVTLYRILKNKTEMGRCFLENRNVNY